MTDSAHPRSLDMNELINTTKDLIANPFVRELTTKEAEKILDYAKNISFDMGEMDQIISDFEHYFLENVKSLSVRSRRMMEYLGSLLVSMHALGNDVSKIYRVLYKARKVNIYDE